jgi:hypothetical protein
VLAYCVGMGVRPPECLTEQSGRLPWLSALLLAPPIRMPFPGEVTAIVSARTAARSADLAARPNARPTNALAQMSAAVFSCEKQEEKPHEGLSPIIGDIECSRPHLSSSAATPPLPRPVLVRWYKDRVANHPPDDPTPSREQDLLAAKAAHPAHTVTVTRVKEVRRQHAPDSWRTGGRRKAQ